MEMQHFAVIVRQAGGHRFKSRIAQSLAATGGSPRSLLTVRRSRWSLPLGEIGMVQRNASLPEYINTSRDGKLRLPV